LPKVLAGSLQRCSVSKKRNLKRCIIIKIIVKKYS